MGSALSQPVGVLPAEVVSNYRRGGDREFRFRMALACHQVLYKKFDPSKLVLSESEFTEVFASAFVNPHAHFSYMDVHRRGRVSSFEQLAGVYLAARDWNASSLPRARGVRGFEIKNKKVVGPGLGFVCVLPKKKERGFARVFSSLSRALRFASAVSAQAAGDGDIPGVRPLFARDFEPSGGGDFAADVGAGALLALPRAACNADTVQRQAFDLQFRGRLRVVETSVGLWTFRKCCGKPRTFVSRWNCPKSFIGLETT